MGKRERENHSGYDLLLAFLLPAAIFLVILFRYRILPFGDLTLLYSDLDGQYIEFMAEYRRMLLGNGSPFYSWHAGIGMNFIGLIAYYLASPFNFLLVLFPEDQLPLAVSVITTLKLGCAGLAFAVFLRILSARKDRLLPIFSAFYALSAYALGYAFNIMWLDALICLPLLCAGIERLLTNRWRGMVGLTLLFAISFLSQFYMAAMTGAFCALYFLQRLFVYRKSLKDCLTDALRFGVCVGIAAGLSSFLLVPAYFVLKNNMGLFGQQFPEASGNFPFFTVFQKLFIGSFDGIKDCLPHIYCGLPALIGLVLFFSAEKIDRREKLSSALIGGLLMFSFWFRPFDFLWHVMDHPSWFPYRYAFIFIFWTLGCAYRGWAAQRSRRLTFIACCVWLIPVILVFFLTDGLDVRFLAVNALFLIAYGVICCVMYGQRRRWLFALCCLSELLIAGFMVTGYFVGGYTRLEDYQEFHEHYRTLAADLQPGKGDFYRIEKTDLRNYNDNLGIGLPGVSHFSSTASTRQAEYLKRLGFNCYATWCTYQGATAALDAMLRIRYELGAEEKTGSVPVREDISEHMAVFPLFYFISEEYARYDFLSDDVNAIQRQNDLLRLLDGTDSGNYFTEIPVRITKIVNLEPVSALDYKRIDPDQPAYIEAEIDPVPGKSSCLFVPGASLNYNVTVNSTHSVINANRDYAPFPVCLDAYANGKTVTVRVATAKDELNEGIFAYALDVDRLKQLSEILNSQAPETEWDGAAGFELRMEPAENDRLVVSSIPFDAGWQVSADGERLPLKMIHESLLGFILPAGCETVRVRFVPYGWNYGVALSGCALAMWVAVLILELRKKKTEYDASC